MRSSTNIVAGGLAGKGRAALTLLESLVAVMLVGVGATAFCSAAAAGMSQNQAAVHYVVATDLAAALMEEIISKPFADRTCPWFFTRDRKRGDRAKRVRQYRRLPRPAGGRRAARAADGSSLADATLSKFSRSATVSYVNLPGRNAALGPGFVVVNVEVKYDGASLVTLTRLISSEERQRHGQARHANLLPCTYPAACPPLPACRKHRGAGSAALQRAFTLIEVLLAASITAAACTVATMLIQTINQTASASSGTYAELATARDALLCIGMLVEDAALVGYWDAGEVLLWRGDENVDGQINLAEMTLVRNAPGPRAESAGRARLRISEQCRATQPVRDLSACAGGDTTCQRSLAADDRRAERLPSLV